MNIEKQRGFVKENETRETQRADVDTAATANGDSFNRSGTSPPPSDTSDPPCAAPGARLQPASADTGNDPTPQTASPSEPSIAALLARQVELLEEIAANTRKPKPPKYVGIELRINERWSIDLNHGGLVFHPKPEESKTFIPKMSPEDESDYMRAIETIFRVGGK